MDLGDGEDEEPGVPFESEFRVYLGGELALSVRARIPAGEVWTVGTLDSGSMTFEPAAAGSFQRYDGPLRCD